MEARRAEKEGVFLLTPLREGRPVWIEQYSLRQWQRVLSAMWSSRLRAFTVVPCSYRRTASFLKEGMYSFGMIVLPLYPIRK